MTEAVCEICGTPDGAGHTKLCMETSDGKPGTPEPTFCAICGKVEGQGHTRNCLLVAVKEVMMGAVRNITNPHSSFATPGPWAMEATEVSFRIYNPITNQVVLDFSPNDKGEMCLSCHQADQVLICNANVVELR